jgi:acetylornithine deacetylase
MNSAAILGHLKALVACDTQNPPRQIHADSEIFQYCSEQLEGSFEVKTWDHGDGHVSWLAVKGHPRILFNVHLDTVPVGEGWSSDPHHLLIHNGRAYGRGSCDIKGAAACLLALAQQDVKNLALLFTSDEEGAGGCCVSNFLETEYPKRFGQVVVAEPTRCEAVLGHRGFLSVKTEFHGTPGHSSEARALAENANHQMALWAANALQVAANKKRNEPDPGTCLNIGIIDGGTKSNVIAGKAFVHWSARLQPGQSNDEFLNELKSCVGPGARVQWEVPFCGEPLPAEGQTDEAAHRFCRENQLPVGNPVDFWTEASLFSEVGLPAIVLGPGDIAQAHATDEWVELEQLEMAYELYSRVVENDG